MPDPGVSGLAYALSEKRLSSQLTTALAADARAMSFAATMVTTAAVLAGFSAHVAQPTAMLIGALLLLLSAATAGFSARPVPFYMPGAEMADFDDDLAGNASYDAVIRQLGKFNDETSASNDRILRGNAVLMRAAFALALLGVTLAAVPQVAAAMRQAEAGRSATTPPPPVSAADPAG